MTKIGSGSRCISIGGVFQNCCIRRIAMLCSMVPRRKVTYRPCRHEAIYTATQPDLMTIGGPRTITRHPCAITGPNPNGPVFQKSQNWLKPRPEFQFFTPSPIFGFVRDSFRKREIGLGTSGSNFLKHRVQIPSPIFLAGPISRLCTGILYKSTKSESAKKLDSEIGHDSWARDSKNWHGCVKKLARNGRSPIFRLCTGILYKAAESDSA